MAHLRTYYVGKGAVTCPDVAEMWGVPLGAPEWQFSDGPVGERGSSIDFPSLEVGLASLSPCNIVWEAA